jgi:hypothetical protein
MDSSCKRTSDDRVTEENGKLNSGASSWFYNALIHQMDEGRIRNAAIESLP